MSHTQALFGLRPTARLPDTEFGRQANDTATLADSAIKAEPVEEAQPAYEAVPLPDPPIVGDPAHEPSLVRSYCVSQCLRYLQPPSFAVHIAPTLRRYAPVRLAWHDTHLTLVRGCFGSIKATSYICFLIGTKTYVYRYRGNRRDVHKVSLPTPLVEDLRLCTTREMIVTALLRAGIESNPGWVLQLATGVIYGLSMPLAPYYAAFAAGFAGHVVTHIDLKNVADNADSVAQAAHNALMHALNGNTTNAERKRLNARAFAFDATNPQTWKFNQVDALAFVKSVRDHKIVANNSVEWVVEKLLMRRGVRLSQAFAMVCERYAPKPRDVYIPFPSNPTYSTPVVPDVNTLTAFRVTSGEQLNARDRRSLARVTKQSGIFNFMPDLGVTTSVTGALSDASSSVNSAASSVSEGLRSHGASISAGSAAFAVAVNNASANFSDSLNQLNRTIANASVTIPKALKDVRVNHSFSLTPISTGPLNFELKDAPAPLARFIELLGDCLPMIVSDDLLVAAAVQPALLRRYGFLTTALADGLILFVKQFMKWIGSDVTKQGGVAPNLDESTLSMLYSVIYALIFQQQPVGAIGSLKDKVMTLNAVATLGKNVAGLATYLIDVFKFVVDWIYENVTGFPYFNVEEREVLAELALIGAKVKDALSLQNPSPTQLEEWSRLYKSGLLVHARALLYDRLRRQADSFKRSLDALVFYQGEIAFESEMAYGRPSTTMIRFVGDGGIGKTTLIDKLVAAVHPQVDWPEADPKLTQINYEYDMNFQTKLAPYSRVVIFDDPFVVQNEEVLKRVLSEFYALGNSRPKKREGVAVTDKERMYEHIELAIVTDMGARNDLPNNNEVGLARRFTAGQWDVSITPAFKKQGGYYLDQSKVTPHNLDDVWRFTSRSDGQVFTFWQIVAHVVRTIKTSREIHQRLVMDGLAIREISVTKSLPPVPNVKIGRSFISAEKQAYFSPEDLAYLTKHTSLSDKKLNNFAATLSREGGFDGYSLVELQSELDFNFPCETTLEFVAEYLRQLVPKGKDPEKAKKIKDMRDDELAKVAFCRGECVFINGTCAEHKSKCPSRVEDVIGRSPAWIRSKLALFQEFCLPSWMSHLYDSYREFGLELPSVPSILTTLVVGLSAKFVLVGAATLLSSLFGAFFVAKMTTQAYSTTYAKIPKRSGQVLPGDPTKQVHLASSRPDTDDWLWNKVATNQIPIAVPTVHSGSATRNKVANLFCVESNLHVTVKHIFVDDPLVGKIALFGDAAVTYPLQKVDFLGWDKVHPIDDSKSIVWWIPIPGLDCVFVVTPRSGVIRPDLSRYLTPAGVPINNLTSVGIVLRPSHINEVDDNYKVTKSQVVAAHVHGAGDVVALERYNIEDSPLGLMARCPNRTPDGSCGSVWFSRNTRVGNGSAKIFAIHGAYIDSQELAVGVPISDELWKALKSLLPPRRMNIVASGREDLTNNGGSINASVVAVATLPKKQAATQNLVNTIKRSPAYDVLVGLEIYHPVLKTHMYVPPPTRIPVDLRNPVRALQKMPLTAVPWTDQMIADYTEAATYVGQRISAQIDQKLADALYIPTDDQVINGDPSLDIPGIDMTTSAGWFPGNKYPGKEAYFQLIDGRWSLRPEWREESDAIYDDLTNGVVPLSLVVDNGKMELRPVGKVPRNTSAYQALVIYNVKKILYWYAVVMKYGRIANQTLYGVDLNSPDGAYVKAVLDRHPYGNQGDYSNFDATIGPEAAAINAEANILPTMRVIRKHGGHTYSDKAILAAVRVQTMVYHIFGDTVYSRWFGNTSGGFLTTPFNNGIGACNYAYCWLQYHRSKDYSSPVWQAYEERVSFLCYGDDYDSTTSEKDFDNLFIEKTIASLGQRVTPAQKATEFTPHVTKNNILKRSPVVRGNKVHWVLDIEVVSEIHAFIRDASVASTTSTYVNMDAALREWYHYGRETFDAVKEAFNGFLAMHSSAQLLLSYSDLDREFNAQYGEHSVLSHVTKQCLITDGPSRYSISAWCVSHPASRVGEMKGAEQALPGTHPLTFTALAPAVSYKRAAAITNPSGPSAASSSTTIGDSRAAESTITDQVALTSYSDDTSVIHLSPPASVAGPARITDPYPDQGMKEVLKRAYRIADVSWTAASAAGTLLYSAAFPEALFTIPNIQEKLKSFRYLKAGARVSFRINANGFAGGTLMIGTIPFYDSSSAGAWRHKFWTLAQSGVTLMSASKADTVEIDLPWISPFQYRDLRSADNRGMIGGIFVYVLNPLVFSNSGAPASLSLSVFASFIDPEVAGPDINGAPALAAVSKQSGEALMKSVKGVIAGVTRATSTVAGVVKPFTSLLPAPFLDKPASLAATMPCAVTPLRGMSNGSGLEVGPKIALDPEAQISVDDSIFGGSKSKPSWNDILSKPGLILVTNFTQAAAADSLIAAWPVRPNFARNAGTTYFPSNLAYYSQFFKRWRGCIKYLIHFACPSNVTARVRISFLPNVTALTAPPENQAGDVMSKVVSITGDTTVVIPIEYLGDTYYKTCQALNAVDTTNTDAIGRITISVLNEVVAVNSAAVTPIAVTVWMAAGPNFVYSKPDDFPDNWAANFNAGLDVVKQSSVAQLMASQTDGLTPMTLLQERGVATPEPFTGILDLLHRFTIRETFDNTTALLVQPKPQTALWLLILPFIGWRGAWRFKVPVLKQDYSAFLGWFEDTENPSALGGYEPSSAGQPGMAEFPYYDHYAWRETYPIMDVLERDAAIIGVSSAVDDVTIFEAVGDDFSLGPLLAPPPLTYTAPPPVSAADAPVSVKRVQ